MSESIDPQMDESGLKKPPPKNFSLELFDCCYHGRSEQLRDYLKEYDCKQVIEDYAANKFLSLLDMAVLENHIEVVKVLLENGMNENNAKENKFTPLMVASMKGRMDMMKILLDGGVLIDSIDGKDKYTALFYAIEKGHIEVIDLLLSYGANRFHLNRRGQSILIQAILNFYHTTYISYNHQIEFIQYLLKQNIDIHVKDMNHRTALHYACIINKDGTYYNIISLLLSHGAYVNARDNKGNTPLFYACQNGYLNEIQLLIEYGADIHIKNNMEETAIIEAYSNGHTEIVQYLLSLYK